VVNAFTKFRDEIITNGSIKWSFGKPFYNDRSTAMCTDVLDSKDFEIIWRRVA